jgi:hypothetical protein
VGRERERESTGMQSFVFWMVLRSLTHKVLRSDATASQRGQEPNIPWMSPTYLE